MSFFSNILQKLGLKKKEEAKPVAAAAAKPAAPVATPVAPKPVVAAPKPAPVAKPQEDERETLDSLRTAEPVAPAKPEVEAISEVDVVNKLEQMASGSALNWKVSIVDLLKVLDLDSSLDARKELAQELGCPEDMMGGDHSKMNIWLHKEVLRQIAQNGGNIPQELLD